MSSRDAFPTLTLSLVQAPLVWTNISANLDFFDSVLEPLKGKTDLIVLPETFATGFVTDPAEIAVTMDGQVMQWMAEKSSLLNAAITGTIITNENNRYYNRLIWMQPDGSYFTSDKRHLFRMGHEHEKFTAGRKSLTIDLKGWNIRPLICYDLRFPVWSKNRYIDSKYEYDLLIYTANWPASRSFVWKSLLTARAIENLAYCAGVNRIGTDGHGLPHSGDSCVLDFKGRDMFRARPNEAVVETITLEYEPLREFRERFNVGPDWDQFNITI